MKNRFIQSLQSVGPETCRCVLTIGNFDGVHLGHQRIVQSARALADAKGIAVVALTFDPPPDLVLRPDDEPQRITPHEQKCRLLAEAGADYVVTATSDKAMLAMSPEEFIDWVIVERFAPRYVVEGRNFFFGHGREGTVEILRGAGAAKGFAVHVIDPVMLKVAETLQRVSSTLIRSLVAAGEVADAARCLGRTFTLYGSVIAGRGQGRQLEFPTANLALGEQVIPADGVYAGRACVAGSQFISAISIGVKPTLGPEERTVEAYLIDADGDYYNKPMSLSFVQRLRGQMKFDGVESLRAQIEKDVQRVEEICG